MEIANQVESAAKALGGHRLAPEPSQHTLQAEADWIWHY
jgi:hypothetical protein